MLDLVDKLRSIEKIEKAIPLPQIVVVGQQSSGKSSVLQAISGIQFPIEAGICTQFPTEIILRREDVVRTKAYIRHASTVSDQQRSGFETFAMEWHNTELSRLPEIIDGAQKILQLTERKRFADESLVLEISGPDQEHLTLIDLPGLFVSTQQGQSSSDITLVNEIAKRYVSNTRAVVLAVISGRNDFENQLILENLKLDISFRKRTLGVITAPDLVEPGSRQESECIQLVQHDPRGLGYGWHVLRNLSGPERSAQGVDRDDIEAQFFQQTAPWNRISSNCVGSQELKKRLSSILKKKIAESLPEIQQEVDLKLEQIYVGLRALGEARQSPGELRNYLCKRADMFEDEMRVMLSGLPPAFPDRTNQTPTLRAFVQSKHELFAQEMFDRASTWQLDPNGQGTHEQLEQIWNGHPNGIVVVNHGVMADFILKKMSQHRGRELSNLPHPDWAAKIFRAQSQRWLKIAQNYGDTIYREMSNRIYQAIERVVEEDTADKLLHGIVEPALRRRKRLLDEKLQELHHPYTLSSIYCASRNYVTFVEELPLVGGTHQYSQSCHLLRCANAFYRVSVDVFTENVISLGVERSLLIDIASILRRDLFYKMSDEELERLGGESDETKRCRQRLLAEQKQFEEARDQILPAFSKQSSRSTRYALAFQRGGPVDTNQHLSGNETSYSLEVTPATPTTAQGQPPEGAAPPNLAKSLSTTNITTSERDQSTRQSGDAASNPLNSVLRPTNSPAHSTHSQSCETSPSSGQGSLFSGLYSKPTSSNSSHNGSPSQSGRRNATPIPRAASPKMSTAGNAKPFEISFVNRTFDFVPPTKPRSESPSPKVLPADPESK